MENVNESQAYAMLSSAVDAVNRKDYQAAMLELDQAERIAPGLPRLSLLRGICYCMTGDVGRGIQSLQRELDAFPECAEARRLLKELGGIVSSSGGGGIVSASVRQEPMPRFDQAAPQTLSSFVPADTRSSETTLDSLTNFDLYLHYPPKTVVRTRTIESVVGPYPCYYIRCADHFKVSTSVVSLIVDSGTFEDNEQFQPDYFNSDWHKGLDTVDRRIMRLGAFTKLDLDHRISTFTPTNEITEVAEYLELSARYIAKYINEIEEKFPEHQHVVFTGGKDSQLVHLVPKRNPKNWHVFSSYPNAPLVKEWFYANKIPFEHFFVHDNQNDEDKHFLAEKVLCADMMINPEHIRWCRAAVKMAEYFDHKCIFWHGTHGDVLYECHLGEYAQDNFRNYFKVNFERGAWWQGTYHQATTNLSGCPVLSLYHSPELWTEVYRRFDPRLSGIGDLRMALGEMLSGKKLSWLEQNPCPEPWNVAHQTKAAMLQQYRSRIRDLVNS